MRARRCVCRERIENEGSRRREYRFSLAESEQRADAATFTAFASNLERQLHRRLENGQLAPRNLATQLLLRAVVVGRARPGGPGRAGH